MERRGPRCGGVLSQAAKLKFQPKQRDHEGEARIRRFRSGARGIFVFGLSEKPIGLASVVRCSLDCGRARATLSQPFSAITRLMHRN
jgi:hypothetical protein